MIKTVERYNSVAMTLHWLTAFIVLALIGVGLIMVNVKLALADKFWLYQLHKSLGISVFMLTFLRIAWRFCHRVPPLPSHMKGWEVLLARVSHIGFYVLLLALPLSGWVRVSSATFNIQTSIFGLIHLPHIPFLEALPLENKKQVEPTAQLTHFTLAICMITLLILHVAGALKHHFVDRDDVLKRMWPFTKAIVIMGFSSALILATAPPVQADNWKIDTAKSTLTFELKIAGQTSQGHIQSFKAEIDFDPGKPDAAAIMVTLDMGSITIGNADGDAALKTKEWFNIAEHPLALYEAQGAKVLGGDKFELSGKLTLKGQTKPLPLPFTLKRDGKTTVASGEITFNRNDFGIGTGVNTGPITVGDDVTIKLKIFAEMSGG